MISTARLPGRVLGGPPGDALAYSNFTLRIHHFDVSSKMMDVLSSPKYVQVADLLRRRITLGDYLLRAFPTDRELASEFEVDTRTARKAVAQLIGAGLLFRQSNGRPAVQQQTDDHDRSTLRIALLTVTYPTPYTARWQRAIEASIRSRKGWSCRLVTYTHLDDAIVKETLEGFDGVFFGLPAIDPTPHFLRTVCRLRRPVVFLDRDMSEHGCPSLWLAPPSLLTKLLDHVGSLGHQRVACLNTQPHGPVIQGRFDAWRRWTEPRGAAGKFIPRAIETYGSSAERAYLTTHRVLDEGGFDATALLCCTSAAAQGVYRAAHERGIVIGRDLAVCCADDAAGDAKFFVPSLTCVVDTEPAPYLAVCLDWMGRGGRDWKGPLHVQPNDVSLFIGESTTGKPGSVLSDVRKLTTAPTPSTR